MPTEKKKKKKKKEKEEEKKKKKKKRKATWVETVCVFSDCEIIIGIDLQSRE